MEEADDQSWVVDDRKERVIDPPAKACEDVGRGGSGEAQGGLKGGHVSVASLVVGAGGGGGNRQRLVIRRDESIDDGGRYGDWHDFETGEVKGDRDVRLTSPYEEERETRPGAHFKHASIAEDDEGTGGPSLKNVEDLLIVEEAQVAGAVCTDEGGKNHVPLAALPGGYRLYGKFRPRCWKEGREVQGVWAD